MSTTAAYCTLALIVLAIVVLNIMVWRRNKTLSPEQVKAENEAIDEETWPFSM
jgi:hypothetical protein